MGARGQGARWASDIVEAAQAVAVWLHMASITGDAPAGALARSAHQVSYSIGFLGSAGSFEFLYRIWTELGRWRVKA